MYNQDQPNFLNSVVEIETSLQPEIMMQVCQGIEMMLGRPMSRKKNEPSFIKYTLQKLSQLKVINFSEMELVTSNNFNKLFFNYEN